jgi:hypothetical protein
MDPLVEHLEKNWMRHLPAMVRLGHPDRPASEPRPPSSASSSARPPSIDEQQTRKRRC